jgi:hypothetical protein
MKEREEAALMNTEPSSRSMPVPAHSESNSKVDINVKRHSLVTGEKKQSLKCHPDTIVPAS